MGPRTGKVFPKRQKSLFPPWIRNPDHRTRSSVATPTTLSRVLNPVFKSFRRYNVIFAIFLTAEL